MTSYSRNGKRRGEIVITMNDILVAIAEHAVYTESLEAEILRLKEVLFCCGEQAVVNFNDPTVGLVDKTLDGFKLPEARFKEIMGSI